MFRGSDLSRLRGPDREWLVLVTGGESGISYFAAKIKGKAWRLESTRGV
jgi:hypothetical protein